MVKFSAFSSSFWEHVILVSRCFVKWPKKPQMKRNIPYPSICARSFHFWTRTCYMFIDAPMKKHKHHEARLKFTLDSIRHVVVVPLTIVSNPTRKEVIKYLGKPSAAIWRILNSGIEVWPKLLGPDYFHIYKCLSNMRGIALFHFFSHITTKISGEARPHR